MLFLECSLSALTVNELRFPDEERDYVYDHLKYCCSKVRPLPAVTISVERLPPVIIAGHKYFAIARELGIDTIPAVVGRGEHSSECSTFLGRPDVRIIDPASIEQELDDTVVLDAWHVFFFRRPLDDTMQAMFDATIVDFFRKLDSFLLADCERKISQPTFLIGGRCAEFLATTPVGDESWYLDFYRVCADFSRTVQRIVSYQGARFVH